MPSITYYHLDPRADLHLGRLGAGQTLPASVPSDTLFSALFVSNMLTASAESWSRGFEDAREAPFVLGSAYPRAGNVRFYPIPQVDLATYGLPVTTDYKKLRRIQYVSEEIWHRILAGESLASLYEEKGRESGFLQDMRFWLTLEEVELLPQKMQPSRAHQEREHPLAVLNSFSLTGRSVRPRVAVDRINNASDIYHADRISFADGCGLWYGVQWLADADAVMTDGLTWRQSLERALALLGDSGLGGLRSVGCGAFDWTAGGEGEWPEPKAGDPCVTLSRYHPRNEELPDVFKGAQVRYGLASVGGYVASTGQADQPRRRLWLVAPGSVLTRGESPVMGEVVDVKPTLGEFPHPVWRCGLALTAGLEVPDA